MEIRQCISFHSFYKYTVKLPLRADWAVQVIFKMMNMCVEKKEAERDKKDTFFFGWNFIGSLPRSERSGLKLFPRAGTLSHVILAGNWSTRLEVEHTLIFLLSCTSRDQEYQDFFPVSHWMTKCILKQGFTHFSCFRYFSLYDSVNTKLWRTWQLDKSCGR